MLNTIFMIIGILVWFTTLVLSLLMIIEKVTVKSQGLFILIFVSPVLFTTNYNNQGNLTLVNSILLVGILTIGIHYIVSSIKFICKEEKLQLK